MITLKTDICSLSRGELKTLNDSLLIACQKVMGKKKGIRVRTTRTGKRYFGKYYPETRTIFMYRSTCANVDKYVSTFIHEYRHAKQKGIQKNYHLQHAIHGYWNNPFEVDARYAQKEFRPEVWKIVKNLYKKKFNV